MPLAATLPGWLTCAVETGGSGQTRDLGRFLPAAVLAVLVLVALVLAQVARGVIEDQEDRMLAQRAREASAYLGSFLAEFEAGLGTIAAVSSIGGAPVFELVASQLLDADDTNVDVVALVRPDADGFVVEAAAGPAAPVTGEDAPERIAEVVAAVGEGMRTTPVFEVNGITRIGLAVPLFEVPGAIYVEAPVEMSLDDDPDAPFRDLAVTLYVGSEARPDQRLIETRPAPGPDAIEEPVPVGDESWLIVVDAARPLAGDLAHNLPLIVLIVGLIVAATVTALVAALARRQAAVTALVDERTEQLEAAQEELVAKERLAAVGQLATTIGHELRNPLGVLTNVNYLLRSRLSRSGDEQALRQVTIAEREVASATLIVSDLLEFSRPRTPTPTDVPLDDLVEEATSVAPPPAHVTIQRSGLDGTVVHADRDQLRQVLLNLLTNAYDALTEGGSVTITGVAHDGTQRLSVADDGIGMDDEQLARAFEPFVTHKAKGIGLGLSVTRRIVEAHGGTLEVTSEPGAGTRFDVVLPARQTSGAS
jgi:signal transduction histidine kinase